MLFGTGFKEDIFNVKNEYSHFFLNKINNLVG